MAGMKLPATFGVGTTPASSGANRRLAAPTARVVRGRASRSSLPKDDANASQDVFAKQTLCGL